LLAFVAAPNYSRLARVAVLARMTPNGVQVGDSTVIRKVNYYTHTHTRCYRNNNGRNDYDCPE